MTPCRNGYIHLQQHAVVVRYILDHVIPMLVCVVANASVLDDRVAGKANFKSSVVTCVVAYKGKITTSVYELNPSWM